MTACPNRLEINLDKAASDEVVPELRLPCDNESNEIAMRADIPGQVKLASETFLCIRSFYIPASYSIFSEWLYSQRRQAWPALRLALWALERRRLQLHPVIVMI